MTKTDIQLKQDIEQELLWDPKVNSAQIGVSVDKGAVSLLGSVDSYPQKWAAEDATKRVSGVRTVAQDLKVMVLADHQRDDTDIARALESTLAWDVLVPKTVTARVENAVVTLEGVVSWNYQRDAAEQAVRNLAGVTLIYNTITIAARASTDEVKERVEAALLRQAEQDASSIHIDITGTKVTLTGHASSWQAIEDATHAAWGAPGITEVVDLVERQPVAS